MSTASTGWPSTTSPTRERGSIEDSRDLDYPAALADLDDGSLLCLPVVRARVRRLPAVDPPGYQAAHRAATVAEFLASPSAAGAGEEKTARFWAEVLAG